MQTTEAILFDLGGVLFNIDYEAPIKSFKKLGIVNADEIYSQASQTHLFDLLEIGKISETDFYDELRSLSKTDIDNQPLRQAWNSILIGMPLNRLELLRTLRKKYKVYLLSNTNQIHENAFNEMLKESLGINSLLNEFDAVFYSHHISKRKPDFEAFEHVIGVTSLDPTKTIYIEDSIQHIESAKKLGFNTLLHQTNSEPEISLKNIGLIY